MSRRGKSYVSGVNEADYSLAVERRTTTSLCRRWQHWYFHSLGFLSSFSRSLSRFPSVTSHFLSALSSAVAVILMSLIIHREPFHWGRNKKRAAAGFFPPPPLADLHVITRVCICVAYICPAWRMIREPIHPQENGNGGFGGCNYARFIFP